MVEIHKKYHFLLMTVLAEAVLRILESVLNGNVFETAKEVVVVKAVQILANLALKENDFLQNNKL